MHTSGSGTSTKTLWQTVNSEDGKYGAWYGMVWYGGMPELCGAVGVTSVERRQLIGRLRKEADRAYITLVYLKAVATVQRSGYSF